MQHFVLDTLVPLGLRIVVTSRQEGVDPEKCVENARVTKGLSTLLPTETHAVAAATTTPNHKTTFTTTTTAAATTRYIEKFVIMNLKPLDQSQQMKVVKQQIPEHSEFFDNLGLYRAGRTKMDELYQATCPEKALEHVPELGLQGNAQPGNWANLELDPEVRVGL